MSKELTYSFYIGNEKVDKLSEEHLERMSKRLSVNMSRYYTVNFEEFKRIGKEKNETNEASI